MIKIITIKVDDNKSEQETLDAIKPSLLVNFHNWTIEVVGNNETIRSKFKEVIDDN